MKFLLYAHGGSGNHGCEGIVAATARLLRGIDSSAEVILSSRKPAEDERSTILSVDKIVNEFSGYWGLLSPLRYMAAFAYRFISKDTSLYYSILYSLLFKNTLKQASDGAVALSIGGDNYCSHNCSGVAYLNRALKKRGCATVLWGCSIERDAYDKGFIRDMQSYDLIVARESRTFKMLSSLKLTNVRLYPDPVFSLGCALPEMTDDVKPENIVGINLSPLIMKYGDKPCVMRNFSRLIEFILQSTDMSIALIPHVVWDESDDRLPLSELYRAYEGTGRVTLTNGSNYCKIKSTIARCRMFVGARTHSIISAYSTCVPAIAIGYSVKAYGIAGDIFGTDKNYVVPVQSLKREDDLTGAFKWLMVHEDDVRRHLRQFMPEYCARAGASAVEIAQPVWGRWGE